MLNTFGVTVQTMNGKQAQTWVTTVLSECQLAEKIREIFDDNR